MEPLKKLQVDGYLMFVEPSNLFGNLDDLCYASKVPSRVTNGNIEHTFEDEYTRIPTKEFTV
ncbi:hypothetical protein X801_06950 [Opisthorchis viverrini]|uniref:Uncharacterized protein n=1 Tax=Opisthorchis viverrini TaxID=6198 RepID=A0A1S8WSH4_OPIVI|nr:hypothetical protein X801_06950 [Opisthorchis viverrini]